MKLPNETFSKNMDELCEIRRNRRITKHDLNLLFPEWKKED